MFIWVRLYIHLPAELRQQTGLYHGPEKVFRKYIGASSFPRERFFREGWESQTLGRMWVLYIQQSTLKKGTPMKTIRATIQRAWCVELGREVSITEARREYLSLENQPEGFTFYCHDPGCVAA